MRNSAWAVWRRSEGGALQMKPAAIAALVDAVRAAIADWPRHAEPNIAGDHLRRKLEGNIQRDEKRAQPWHINAVGVRIVGFERRVTIAFAVNEARDVVLRVFHGGRNLEGVFE